MDDLREIIRKVLDATYSYWDGYYLPQDDPEGWTEDKIIDYILQEKDFG